ncbi:MAG: CHASE2 domain-containing protein, partial [Roseobacter sp.]
MTPTRAQNRLVILAVLGVLVWCAIVVLPSFYGRASFTDSMENWLLDLRYAVSGSAVPAQDIVIVAIDDATLADEAVAAFSRRALLGLLATRIAQSDGKTLALDVLLADRGDVDEDAGLLQALGQVPSVIAAAAVFDDGARAMGRMIWPLDAFRAVAQAGAVNVSTDANGVPRYIPLLVMVDGTMVPSLPLLAALEFTGQEATFETTELVIGSRRVPLDREFNMPLRALGPTGTVQTLSAQVLLDGPAPDRLAGKMVVMGYTATATADRFETPFSLNTP